MQVRFVGRRIASRIDDDELRALLHPIHHPQEENRVAVRHVGAGDEEDVRVVEILVRTGGTVGAEGLLVTRAGAGHA